MKMSTIYDWVSVAFLAIGVFGDNTHALILAAYFQANAAYYAAKEIE